MFDVNLLRASLAGPRAARALRLCQDTVANAESILVHETQLKGSRYPGRVICSLIAAGLDQLEEGLTSKDTGSLVRAVGHTRSLSKTMVSVALTPKQWAAIAFLRQALEEASGDDVSETDVVRALAHLTVSEVYHATPAVH